MIGFSRTERRIIAAADHAEIVGDQAVRTLRAVELLARVVLVAVAVGVVVLVVRA